MSKGGVPIQRFTPAEDARLAKMLAAGGSIRMIALDLGRNRSSIRDRVRLLNEQGMAGCAVRSIRKFSAEEDEKLLEMVAKGKTIGQIGQALGRPYSSLVGRLRLLRERQEDAQLLREKKGDAPPPRKTSANSRRGECKCLGGCGRTFVSEDRLRIRICRRCKQRHERMSSGMDD